MGAEGPKERPTENYVFRRALQHQIWQTTKFQALGQIAVLMHNYENARFQTMNMLCVKYVLRKHPVAVP